MSGLKWLRTSFLISAGGLFLAVFLLQSCSKAGKLVQQTSAAVATAGATASPMRASTLLPARARLIHPTATLAFATPTVTSLPPGKDTTEVPDSFYIANISGHRQWYSIGCEASAAVDWAAFFGVPIYEREFQTMLPKSDNPDLGFVGNVNGAWGLTPPEDYGVHAAPVAELLRWYGLDAVAKKGLTLEDLEASIAQSMPVIA